MIFANIKTGLVQTFRNRRMIVLYYGVNLLFACLIMFPFRSLVKSFLGNSVMAQNIAVHLDINFILEFLIKNRDALPMLGGLIAVVAFFYVFIEVFLSGGAFTIFAAGTAWDGKAFWTGAAEYFGRFLRLALWWIPVFLVLFLLQYIRVETSEIAAFWSRVVRICLGYAGIILAYAVFDYARIYCVTTGDRSMRRAIWRGVKFTFRNFIKTFGLALAVYLFGILVLIAYNPASDALHAQSGFMVFLLFLLQQFCMIVRMALKLTLYAGQTDLYKKLQAVPGSPGVAPAPDAGMPDPDSVTV